MNKILNLFSSNNQANADVGDKFDAMSRVQSIIECSPDGTIESVNAIFLKSVGYQELDLVGKHHRTLLHENNRSDTEYQIFWRALKGGQNQVSEFKYANKNGDNVWMTGAYTPIKNSSGDVYKVIGFVTDISKQKKQAEQAKAQADISNALMLCQANVMLADKDLNIVYLNKTVREMLQNREAALQTELPNFKVDKLIGTNVDGFHKSPSHQRKILSQMSESYVAEIKIAGITFELIASPWLDLDGHRIGSVVEWEDKTDRLALEQEANKLADENARIAKALEVCNTSVMMADEDLKIMYMNKAVERMLKAREVELKDTLPNFNTQSLMGTCVDDFHKSPSHQRSLLKDLTSSYKTNLNIGDLIFGLTATPIINDEGKRLGTVVEWVDKTDQMAKDAKEKAIAEENSRVKQALDNVTANVMIADNDANIIYTNHAVIKMMRNAESDIKKDLPGFDSSALMGTNIDGFHKKPQHQRNLLKDLNDTYLGRANVGGRSFTVIANPVFQEGQRVGTVVEWDDKTEEMLVEQEISDIVSAVGRGDFSRQATLEGKQGFALNLSKGLNDLTSIVEVALNDVLRMLGALSRGDLSERITRDYEGAYGELKNNANNTADKLTDVISKIRISSNSISTAAGEIAQGNADLSQRTEEQASSLEETASSMEQMTSTVKQSAVNAETANTKAVEAQNIAEEGGDVVERAVVAMGEINHASKKISDIISVIDEIAFQTNLLALNAAVEAARAGEQGRGFAVVAGEVRNLAQRSAGAAKEIKDLIRDTVNKVDDGTALVNQSGQTLADIVLSVKNVTNMMREIADAAREQTSGIEQVNAAVSQMDEMTQKNAALVEEATAAGESMADQARLMTQVVSFFNTQDGGIPEAKSVSHVPESVVSASANMHAAQTANRNINSTHNTSSPQVNTPSMPASMGSDDEWEDF